MKWKRKIVFAFLVLFVPFNSIAASLDDELIEASDKGELDKVEQLIPKGAKANYKGKYGLNALQRASVKGHVEIASYLLSKGWDPNIKWDGYTPLMQASSSFSPGGQDEAMGLRYIEIIDALLRSGAKVNVKNNSGWTALMMASYGGFQAAVEMLIQYGADPKIKNKRGETAISIAEDRGYTEIVEILKKAALKP